jgi:hypothetical protein
MTSNPTEKIVIDACITMLSISIVTTSPLVKE